MKIRICGRYKIEKDTDLKMNAILSRFEFAGHIPTFDNSFERIVSFDFARENIPMLREASRLGIPRILVREESDTVYPEQFTSQVESLFSQVVNLGLVTEIYNGITLNFPYLPYGNHHEPSSVEIYDFDVGVRSQKQNLSRDWNMRDHDLVFVGSNKIVYDNTLYDLRRKVLQNLGANVEIYGLYWRRSELDKYVYLSKFIWHALRTRQAIPFNSVKNYLVYKAPDVKSVIQDKLLLLRNSKFNLIVENSNNFMTEKIFDALVSGCIQIYLNSHKITKEKMRECVIEVDLNQSIENVCIQILESIRENQYKRLESGFRFLHSKEFKDGYMMSAVIDKLIKIVEESP